MKLKKRKSLKRYNSFGLEVSCSYFSSPTTVEQLVELLSDSELKDVERVVIGSGSNILFTKDYEGLVIHPAMAEIEIVEKKGSTLFVRVGAGVEWDDFVEWSVDRGWGGVENLSGIPGKVGASPVQNIGAYGAEVGEIIETVEGVTMESGERVVISNEEAQFGYRESIFKGELKGKFIITHVTYRLSVEPIINIDYADLRKELSHIESPTPKDVRAAVLKIRDGKLPDPDIIGNAGSFFKNPIVDRKLGEKIKSKNPSVTLYPVGEESCKVPAGWMIDQCGFKGYREGRVGVHDRQALVLVAEEGATGEELIQLAEKIKRSVLDRFGIELTPEVNIL